MGEIRQYVAQLLEWPGVASVGIKNEFSQERSMKYYI